MSYIRHKHLRMDVRVRSEPFNLGAKKGESRESIGIKELRELSQPQFQLFQT